MKAWRGLIVLNYHRIGDPRSSELDRGVFSATAEDFEAQLRAVARHCDVISVKDLDRARLDRKGRYAMITFDDGYRDNFTDAFPVLRDLRLPAVFFLTSGYLDHQLVAWWDEIAWMVRSSTCEVLPVNSWFAERLDLLPPHREESINRLLSVYKGLSWEETEPYLEFLADATGAGRCQPDQVRSLWMTWDMVRAMHQVGLDFGGHTVTHPILSRLTPASQLREIADNKQRIEDELKTTIEAFSYPVGAPDAFDAETFACLDRVGYRYGFSFYGGFTPAEQLQPFDIPRLAVSPELTPTRLNALLTLPQVFADR